MIGVDDESAATASTVATAAYAVEAYRRWGGGEISQCPEGASAQSGQHTPPTLPHWTRSASHAVSISAEHDVGRRARRIWARRSMHASAWQSVLVLTGRFTSQSVR